MIWCICMSRYQIYLEPNTVATIDDLSSALDLSRSQIIRDVLDRVAREYKKVIFAAKGMRKSSNSILKMDGIIDAPITDLSTRGDEYYLRD